MPHPDRSNALDHIVVLMFENRSFDNLLGRLYEPGEVASFEGVIGEGFQQSRRLMRHCAASARRHSTPSPRWPLTSASQARASLRKRTSPVPTAPRC
jgi:hypothetical protein